MKTIFKLSALAAVLVAANIAHAATATSSVVTISLPVNAPTCTVANSGSTITLPAANLGATWSTYQTVNLPTTAVRSSYYTAATLNQTATISCTTANASISSFVVQPSASAVTSGTGSAAIQYLVDTATTPVKAFGGAYMVAEQVSVNGTAAAFDYANSGITSYTTAFTTGALDAATPPMSTATVVWRPAFSGTSSNTVANPTGGSYGGSFSIVINY